jgi:NADH-quinone oxidoreductase subunit J
MVGQSLTLGGNLPVVLANVLPPTAILILCAVAGLGTFLLLPSHRPAMDRRIGGVLLTAGLLILAAMAIHAVAGPAGVGGAAGLSPYFWIFSVIAIVGAVRVVTHPRPVYSALYFVLTVFASAGLFVLLAADFVAAALVLIYAGAILITYVFVIMLAAQASNESSARPLAGLAEYDLTSREPFVAVCVGFSMMGVLMFLLFDKGSGLSTPQPLADSVSGQIMAPAAITGPTQALGEYLFRHQLVNLELAGLILTLAMIGAIVIARRKIVGSEDSVSVEVVVGPSTPINDDPHSIPVFGSRNPAQKAYPET